MNEDQLRFGATDRPEHFLQPKAWLHSEIAGGFAPAVWKEKSADQFATYPKRNQGQQSSCVLYALAKALAVDEITENGAWRELSPRSLYPYLVQPGGGSNSLEAAKLACKIGMTLEHLLPMEGLSEADAEKDTGYVTDAKQVALIYKPGNFVECNADFDTIASILQTFQQQGIKKVVMVTIMGQNNGTMTSSFITPPSQSNPNPIWYHRVPVCDFGTMAGKKYLSIDNSWGDQIGNKGQQFIGEEYQPYMYGGIYTLNQPDNWQAMAPASIPMPKHVWNTDLSIGSSGNDVLVLQQALQSVGMFPIAFGIKPTGYYGGLTRASVISFQAAFGIQQTGNVGPITRAKLNEIFA